MGEILQFEDIKKKDKIIIERRLIKAGKAFIDFLSEIQQIEQNIEGKYQVLNAHFENNIRMKRLIEECGLSTDLSIRMMVNNEPSEK